MKNLELLLNRNCNLNCSYCGVKDNSINEQESKFNKFIEFLDKNDFKSCKILGGEPTINIDYIKILEELEKRNIKTEVYTNGKISYKTLKESFKYNIKYIVSIHYDEIDLKEVYSNIKLINTLNKLSSVKFMWNGNQNIVSNFKIYKQILNVPVFLEPIFKVKYGLTDTKVFEESKKLDLLQYSEILNIKNKYLNKSFYEMFIDKDDSKPKICEIQKHNTLYDYQNLETFRCLTDCIDGVFDKSEYCTNTHCLCDLEHIKEIL